MSKKVTKVALIGAGTMAEYHLKGFREAGADIVGLVDSNPEKGSKFASKWEIAGGCHSTLEALMKEHPEIQAVSVITPNKFHHPQVMDALSRKLHVFCEKPPALNASQICEMANCAKKNRRVLMFNLNNRARLDSRHIKDLIMSGEAGRINSAQATWMRRTGIPGFGGWFTTKDISGGGCGRGRGCGKKQQKSPCDVKRFCKKKLHRIFVRLEKTVSFFLSSPITTVRIDDF